MEDLSGMQFNNWLVIEYCGKSEWLCECQCENIFNILKMNIFTIIHAE